MWLARFMYRAILLAVLLSLPIQTPALAQSSPAGPFNDNLGSWTWGKQQPPPSDDEIESAFESDEDEDEGLGETSWERMSTERSEEAEPSAEAEEPKQLTPFDLWRFIWGKISNDD